MVVVRRMNFGSSSQSPTKYVDVYLEKWTTPTLIAPRSFELLLLLPQLIKLVIIITCLHSIYLYKIAMDSLLGNFSCVSIKIIFSMSESELVKGNRKQNMC
jgi:hypothetical protein